jgi:hypothetical protein
MWQGALPACCEQCEAYDRGPSQCRLLAHPTPENRRALLVMPCDIEALVPRRLRGQGDDVALEALEAWLSPDLTAEEVLASFGHASLDARLWLTSWPYLFLARNAVRRRNRPEPVRHRRFAAELEGTGDPAAGARMIRALDQLLGVDPIGLALVIDVLRGELDVDRWCHALGMNEHALDDKKYLAVYRYAVIFHDVLPKLPEAPRAALSARRFARANHSDADALAATRVATGMALSHGEWLTLYREGVSASLVALAAPEALGVEAMGELGEAFRHVLGVEEGAP